MTAEHGTRRRVRSASERAANRHRARRRAMGDYCYTDAAPVRAHVRSLLDAGMGYPQLSKVSGVEQSSLIYLMCGRVSRTGRPPERMSIGNAEALLAVRAPELAAGARIVHVGAMRRGQALVAAGWGLMPLSKAVGMSVTILRRIVYGQPVWKASTDTLIEAYDRLWDQLPEQETSRQRAAVTQARLLARRKGWSVPMCWDDATIDDPDAKPDTGLRPGQWGAAADAVEVAELVAGRLPADAAVKASREEAYRLLFADGWTAESVAAQMQVSDRTAQRAKARLSRPPTAEEAA